MSHCMHPSPLFSTVENVTGASCSMPIECEDVLDRKMSRKMYVCPELNVYYNCVVHHCYVYGHWHATFCNLVNKSLQVTETAH